MKLAEIAEARGYRLAVHDQIDSTNDEAMRRARSGDPGRLWVVAASQSGGRGRQGRSWSSPSGNLHASLLLIDPSPPALAPQIGFVAGVALAQGVRSLLGGDFRLVLKWPNDLLHDGAKLSGLLLEGSTLADGRFACVVGCGVNCRAHPDGLAYPATDLAALGSPCGASEVFESLSAGMVRWLDLWQGGAGFEAVRAAWLREAAPAGTQMRVSGKGRTLEGRFRTIDASGRLVLDTSAGPQTVEAGDVFLVQNEGGEMRRSEI